MTKQLISCMLIQIHEHLKLILKGLSGLGKKKKKNRPGLSQDSKINCIARWN